VILYDFQALYESSAQEVYRFAFWLAGDSAEAEDITSETFIRAWVNHAAIRTEALKTHLFTIARNYHLEEQRRKKRPVVLEEVYSDPAPGPAQIAELRPVLEKVRKVLQTLPEIYRAAFILRVQHELPYVEIGRILGLSLSVAMVRVHRARFTVLFTRCRG